MNRQLRNLATMVAASAALSSVAVHADPANATASPFPASAVGTYRGVSFEQRSRVTARWSEVHGRDEEHVQSDVAEVYTPPCHGGNPGAFQNFAVRSLFHPIGWLIAPIVVPIAVIAAIETSLNKERCARTP
jgi:hypothetical protein